MDYVITAITIDHCIELVATRHMSVVLPTIRRRSYSAVGNYALLVLVTDDTELKSLQMSCEDLIERRSAGMGFWLPSHAAAMQQLTFPFALPMLTLLISFAWNLLIQFPLPPTRIPAPHNLFVNQTTSLIIYDTHKLHTRTKHQPLQAHSPDYFTIGGMARIKSLRISVQK